MRTSVIRWIGAYRRGVRSLASSLEWELTQTTKQVCAELILFPRAIGPAVPIHSRAYVGLFADERDVLYAFETDCWSDYVGFGEFWTKEGDLYRNSSSRLVSRGDADFRCFIDYNPEARRNALGNYRKELRHAWIKIVREQNFFPYSEVFLQRGWKATGIAIASKARNLEEYLGDELADIAFISKAYDLPVYHGVDIKKRTRNGKEVWRHRFVRVDI